MNELIEDKNGIWVDKESVNEVFYPEDGHEVSFSIEENGFWFIHRNHILKSVLTRFPFTGNYADIGGANGFQAKYIANAFPQAKVYLLEPGYQGCLNAKKRGLEHVYNITFQKFDFAANNVNAVGLYDVIEHIENDVDFLVQLKNKLPKNSFIYITVPAYMSLWSDVDEYGGHFRRYNKKMIEELGVKAGVELKYFSYFFIYLPLITYFVRRIPYKLRGKREDATIINKETDNHNPPGIMLKCFDLFHKYELNKIQKSQISHGGSCVAVFKT